MELVDALPVRDSALKRQEVVRMVFRAQEKKIALVPVWNAG